MSVSPEAGMETREIFVRPGGKVAAKQSLVHSLGKNAPYQAAVDFGPIRPIRNDADYASALARLEHLEARPKLGNAERDMMDVLLVLTRDYRDRWLSQAIPDGISAIRFAMQQKGLTQADLSMVLGSRSRASEILHGKRSLTLDQIRRLHQAWSIPADFLIKENTPTEPAGAE